MNIGCESCHGAGSAHVKAPAPKKAATIVNPGKLASERASVICGQCHSRPQGFLNNYQPVNKDNKMMTPGISRKEYLVVPLDLATSDTAMENYLTGRIKGGN